VHWFGLFIYGFFLMYLFVFFWLYPLLSSRRWPDVRPSAQPSRILSPTRRLVPYQQSTLSRDTLSRVRIAVGASRTLRHASDPGRRHLAHGAWFGAPRDTCSVVRIEDRAGIVRRHTLHTGRRHHAFRTWIRTDRIAGARCGIILGARIVRRNTLYYHHTRRVGDEFAFGAWVRAHGHTRPIGSSWITFRAGIRTHRQALDSTCGSGRAFGAGIRTLRYASSRRRIVLGARVIDRHASNADHMAGRIGDRPAPRAWLGAAGHAMDRTVGLHLTLGARVGTRRDARS